jgi:CopG family transcriptional regulator/antitoxin EndoAI
MRTYRAYDAVMKGGSTTMRKRVNITLPEETLELIDRVTEHGDRSRLIDEAVRHYIQETSRANLRKRVKEGAIRRAERDLQLAEEWFNVDEAVWHGGRQ